ncbi:MAG: endolytic transglycosylase MltG [Alkalimonas sp.]|nr:endolytic transglycosylase MltG [Alkalimonas sp.]
MLRRLIVLALALLFLAAVLVYQQMQQLATTPLQLTSSLFTVPAGASASGLCRQWQREGYLQQQDCQLFRLQLWLDPELAAVKAGTYQVDSDSSLIALIQQFVRGDVAQFPFTIREGETLQQTLKRLQHAEHLIINVDSQHQLLSLLNWPEAWGETPEHAEGLFFPETYHYTVGSSASQLLRRAHQNLLKHLEDSWQQRHFDIPLKSPYELLIMASIIEKESGYEPEKPLISSVFMNRIRDNMRLQTDPTVIYGLENFSGRITRADLQNPHPYNTYRHHGLPPSPIAAVSLSSLQAAARPVDSSMYYFVSKGDGSHVFSETLQEHNAAVRRYILGQNDSKQDNSGQNNSGQKNEQ